MKKEILKKVLQDNNYPFPNKDIENYLIQCADMEISKNLTDRHSVSIEVGTDNVTAEMMSLYNIFKFSQRKFVDFLMTMTQSMVSLSIPNQTLGAALSVLFFCWSILNATVKKFGEQDAKVLLSLYRIGGRGYVEDIANSYINLFASVLSYEKIIQSLQLLSDYRVISQQENGEITIIEEIEIVRV